MPTSLELPSNIQTIADTPQQPPQGETSPQKQAWKPYERQWTETALPLVDRMPAGWYRFRWACWYPLQARVLWGMITLGELLLILGACGAAGAIMAATNNSSGKTGDVAQIPLILTFTFACRNSAWTFLVGVPFERAMLWHKVMSYLAVAMGLFHGIRAWYLLNAEGPDARYWGLQPDNLFFWSGWVFLGAMIINVLLSALPHFRRAFFKTWLLVHWLMLLLTLGMGLYHSANMLYIALVMWGVDLALRYIWMAGLKNPHEVEIVALPGDVVRITWPKGAFEYMGGQYVFVCVPSLSIFEWHPFSLSSHPDSGEVHLHVRVLGDWTRALHTLAAKGEAGPKRVKAYIEGPFGSPAVDVCGSRHTMFLLISGGIGVTPMQSIMNELLTQHARGRPLQLLWFVWSVRDKHMINTVLDYDRKYAEHRLPNQLPSSFSPDLVSPNVHVSREVWREQDPDAKKAEEAEAPPTEEDNALGFLHTEFYLTQARDASQFHAGGISPEKQRCLRFGRPDIRKILLEAGRIARDKQVPRVAVMVCGPRSMINDVQRLASELSGTGGVRFEIHSETFDL